MPVVRGSLLVSLQVDLTSVFLHRLQTDLLERIRDTGARGVVLDVSGLEIVDCHQFEQLRRTVAMVSLLGARTVLVGLGPGVAASLVDLDVQADGLKTVLALDEAFALLQGDHG